MHQALRRRGRSTLSANNAKPIQADVQGEILTSKRTSQGKWARSKPAVPCRKGNEPARMTGDCTCSARKQRERYCRTFLTAGGLTWSRQFHNLIRSKAKRAMTPSSHSILPQPTRLRWPSSVPPFGLAIFACQIVLLPQTVAPKRTRRLLPTSIHHASPPTLGP